MGCTFKVQLLLLTAAEDEKTIKEEATTNLCGRFHRDAGAE
jgi:hypothetical protein